MNWERTLMVLVAGLATALATGLGALPFRFIKETSPRVFAIANSIAAGLMLGASFGLVVEGANFGMPQTVLGGALGVLMVLAGEKLFEGRETSIGDVRGKDARRTLLLLAVMTVHSFSEGVAVGVAFGGGEKLATMITVAIAVHNIPEGLAISAVLRSRGSSLRACAGWSIFSSLPQPLMAVPAFLFVDAFTPVLPYGLGFAAGAMVFMVLLELLPEAYESARESEVGLWVSLTLGAMVLFQRYL